MIAAKENNVSGVKFLLEQGVEANRCYKQNEAAADICLIEKKTVNVGRS